MSDMPDGCACPVGDAQECAELRHHYRTGRWPEFPMEPCECPCHGESEPWPENGDCWTPMQEPTDAP